MKSLLMYKAKPDEIAILKSLVKEKDIDLKSLDEEDLDEKIGYLLGREGFEKSLKKEDSDSFDFTFLLFDGFNKDEVFSFLKEMREKNLTIPHKATSTPTNVNWTLSHLLLENDGEHQTMKIIEKINCQLKKAKEIKEKKGEDPEISALIKEINAYFADGENFDVKVADDYSKKLKDLVDKL